MRTKLTKDARNRSSPWVVRWYEGVDPVTGKEQWPSKSFTYKAQAVQFRAELKAKGREALGTQTSSSVVTLQEFQRQWTET